MWRWDVTGDIDFYIVAVPSSIKLWISVDTLMLDVTATTIFIPAPVPQYRCPLLFQPTTLRLVG
jgi:hypothetical protein